MPMMLHNVGILGGSHVVISSSYKYVPIITVDLGSMMLQPALSTTTVQQRCGAADMLQTVLNQEK